MKNDDALFLKIRITKIGLLLRLAILICASVLFFIQGFMPSDYLEIVFILFPLNSFYITVFTKFIIKNLYKFPDRGLVAGTSYKRIGYYGMLVLNIFELSLIICKALVEVPSTLVFLWLLVGAETIFGFLSGFFISDLFAEKP